MSDIPSGYVKVRIAVAVALDGSWNSSGYDGATDSELAANAVDCMPEGERICFVEALAPKPEVQSIEGRVVG